MDRFLRNFEFHRTSFWLGFVAATLFWWLLWRLRPIFLNLLKNLRERIREAREGLTASTEARFKADMLRYTQSLHIAAPLFSLDEIIVEPHLLVPPPPPWIENAHFNEHIASQTIPFTPDWPEIGSEFQTPSRLLPELLAGDTHIAVVAEPGMGKSTALAHLIGILARRKDLPEHLKGLIPVYIHAGELFAASEDIQDPQELLFHTAGLHVSGRTRSRLKNLLTLTLESGRILLILDDLDEPPPEDFDKVLEIFVEILNNNPKIRAIVAASPQYTGGLVRSGFRLYPMAAWTSAQKLLFLDRWGKMWEKHVVFLGDQYRDLEPSLLNAWLLEDTYPGTTPLELTLLAWGAYAGDSRGRSVVSALQAAIYRMIAIGDPSDSSKLIDITNELAFKFIQARSAWIHPADMNITLHESTPDPIVDQAYYEQDAITDEIHDETGQRVRLGKHLETLKLSNLIRTILPSQIAFTHPVFLGYLASRSSEAVSLLSTERDAKYRAWSTAVIVQRFVLQRDIVPKAILDTHTKTDDEPLFTDLLNLARSLGSGGEEQTWKTIFLRRLVNIIQSETYPFSLRIKALTAVIQSESTAISTLLQRLCKSQQPRQRQLGALGFGFTKDVSGIETLITLLGDVSPNVYRSASISLVGIGKDAGLHAIAEMLLTADEDRRRAAAEALAVHAEEGYPVLKDGAEIEDLLVRKAVVFGLKRVGERWALEILEDMRLNDAQWVVKNAAAQALDELTAPDPRLPYKLTLLKDTPWLIAYAAELGEGISGHQSAYDMLLKALKDGNDEQKLSALHTILLRGQETGVEQIFDLLYSDVGEVSETAFYALWSMHNWGIELPLRHSSM